MEPDPEPLEIELKLALPRDKADALFDDPLLRRHARGEVRSRQLRAVYYDTPDRRLHGRELDLRVRQSGRRFVQTLKGATNGSAAHFARREWEVERPDLAPDLKAFGDPAVLDRIGLVLPEELVPVFETSVRRRILDIAWSHAGGPPALIELALDTGVVSVNGKTTPIAELELELKAGDPADLYDLADSLRRIAELRLEPLAKSARGWLLVTGEPPPWHKPGAPAVNAGMTVEGGLAAVLGSCLGHWIANEAAARDGRDPEGVHQLRVALRRIRSALTLFQPALGDVVREYWNGELRWVLGELGPARDLDVLATVMLPPLVASRRDDAALGAFGEAVERRRAAARGRVGEALASRRYGDLVLGFAAWVARGGWRSGAEIEVLLRQREPLAGFADRILAKRHRQVQKRGRQFAALDAEARHKARIAMKKLRYGTEFFADLYPGKEVRRFRKATTRLQDVLGHLNDVSVASTQVARLVAEEPPGPAQASAAIGGGQLIGWYAAQVPGLEPEAVAGWDAFRRLEPFWRRPDRGAS